MDQREEDPGPWCIEPVSKLVSKFAVVEIDLAEAVRVSPRH